jgi:HD-GYP domain-containing protein (c-di-GMP phosphodiesterase class II)
MRHLNIDSINGGETLGKSIYSQDGRTLLQSGVLLTPIMINTLRRIGVTMIYIKDKQFQDVKIEDIVSDETRRLAIVNVSDIQQSVQEGKDFDLKSVGQTITNIIDEILRNKDMLLTLSDIRTKDNHSFIHSLNVCIMSTIIGINMGFNQVQLKELALGALLHDVGKVVNENSPLKKALSEESDHHTWVGFNLLRKKHELSLATAHIALQHHEHVDGSGIPRNLVQNQIHVYGKIVAIANYYDNLISEFLPGPTYLPFEANEYVMGLAGKYFDLDIVLKFLRSIALYPSGTSVKLSNGQTGVVVGQHKGLPARPIIRVIKKLTREEGFIDNDTEVKEIDLAKETTIFIKDVLKV